MIDLDYIAEIAFPGCEIVIVELFGGGIDILVVGKAVPYRTETVIKLALEKATEEQRIEIMAMVLGSKGKDGNDK